MLSSFEDLSTRLKRVDMAPCWATMALFAEPFDLSWSGAFVDNSLLSWAARNGSKPGRLVTGESLILHANPKWTAENWEQPPEVVARIMLDEFWRVAKSTVQSPSHLQAHRWKYALPSGSEPVDGPIHDDAIRVVACGDWSEGSRVEGAFLSGCKAAQLLLNATR
jgi:predicted NAD/FAD-dependent oxidoreductase